MADPSTLLAYLSWRFHPRMEELAVEALAYILNRHPASREGLDDLVARAVPGMKLSAGVFKTEAVALDKTRPDVVQEGADGRERLFIEAKFYAPLTQHQPVSYLNRLPEKLISVLVFLAPAGRLQALWPELLSRLDGDVPYSQVAPHCVSIDGTGRHLLLMDWTTLLDAMAQQLEDSDVGLAELRQLRGLVRFAISGQEKARRPGKRLVNRVTEIGKASGWLDTSGLIATPRSYGFGRYVRLGHRYKLVDPDAVWLGVNSELDAKPGSGHLWLSGSWDARVRSALQAHIRSVQVGGPKRLWVPIAPEGRKGADEYAAELERIAGILDDLTAPWHSRADVLAEVIRRYEQRVMSNAHRAEYVEALVALALRDSGWARKAPWESCHFEHESGKRLRLRHSAAVQSWGHGEIPSAPRFGIAPGRRRWDEGEGRCVEPDARFADVYVFAWHGAPGESADQGNPTSWEFYVVSESDLPEQKTIALKALQGLTSPCGIDGLAGAVDLASRHRRRGDGEPAAHG